MSGFPTSVQFDVPVVDGDAMGRAFPTMYHGKSSVPARLAQSLCKLLLIDGQRTKKSHSAFTANRWYPAS